VNAPLGRKNMDKRYRTRLSRYLDRETAQNKRALDKLDYSSWFDYWHTHPDWRMKCNRFSEAKAMAASATYGLLQYAEQLAAVRNGEIQVFGTLCENTGDNAVYLHSVNPNGTPFPVDFSEVQWDVSLLGELAGIVNTEQHQVGAQNLEDGSSQYLIRARA
jgi:hypothetical protein